MLDFIKLETKEQFMNLKGGDQIVVKWSDHWVDHTPKAKKVMTYNIYQNKGQCDEIICQKKDNHYFNYLMHLEGRSAAEEVYLISNQSN